MVILRSQNKITDFLMILAWASPFNHLIIDNNVFPIEITEAFAKKPLGIKGSNMFSKFLVVVYIALLTMKLFEMVYYKRKLSSNRSFYAIYQIRLYTGGHLGRHLEYVSMLGKDFLERLPC